MAFYTSNGKPIGEAFVKSINHRGYGDAPENTLPAYIKSWEMGFRYVECDVSFTADNIPVLLHDDTINRTSNGTGAIKDLTFNEVRQLDFGSWKSEEYAGTKIPSFDEFIKLCRCLNLHPYIEIKESEDITTEKIADLLVIVRENGMLGNVTWISFSLDFLNFIKISEPSARLGYLEWDCVGWIIDNVKTLKTADNEVFLNVTYPAVTDEKLNYAISEGVPVECFNVNDEATIINANPYISGYTTDFVHAGKVLFENTYGAKAVIK